MLKQTPLFKTHSALNGRMVPFAGWEMPIQFEGILAESRAVRSNCGLFDVSHMGRIILTGPHAEHLLDWVHTSTIAAMAIGHARYGLLCNSAGGIIDDCIIYRLRDDRYLMVANASNRHVVLDWLHHWTEERFHETQITDITDHQAMIAFQGPNSIKTMGNLVSCDLTILRPFRCIEGKIMGRDAIIARTGYTGEDGIELILASEDAPWLWTTLLEHGATPCGLGARDVLRLEAGLPLHGTDIDINVNPVEANLMRFVKLENGDFSGANVISNAVRNGVSQVLTGFITKSRRIPRHGYSIQDGRQLIGRVTSGGYSPTLDMPIGMGYVPVQYACPGTRFQVDVRGRSVDADTVALPFYSRKS